jgi:pimeloyl-ACP methyl ester carboxylesterase
MTPSVSSVALGTGITLSYATVGDRAAPAVILVPGPTDSWRSYESVLDWFPASVRVIAVSPRGHGDSDKPLAGYRVEDFAADVAALFDALDIERAVVAGHSGSCLTVRRVAIDHPERVAGLILEASPTTLGGDPGLRASVEAVISSLQDPIDPSFARSFVTDTSTDQLPAELVDQLAGELMKVPVPVWKEMFAGLLAYDDFVELDQITAPALLLWGDGDGLVNRDMQTMLAERIRGSQLLVYHGIGHTPHWEDPARFARDVATFAKGSLQPRR